MAILGQANILVGVENQATGSDSIYTAFNKVVDNFDTLFTYSSPFNTFNSGNGITATPFSSNGSVFFENTGVTSLIAGTGITISSQTGEIVISSAGGEGMSGVTSVGISSISLDVSDSPIVSSGLIRVELPTIETGLGFEPGDYITPALTVDAYGRITSISNTSTSGTVTSIALDTVGDGIGITGGPITDNGTIVITNTGVTRINAGNGIELSGSTGNVTINSTLRGVGVVSRVDVDSTTLTVLNSPITSSGTITVDIPDDISLAGNLIANTITSNSTATITGNITVGNITSTGTITSLGGNILLGANLVITTLSGTGGPSNILTIGFTTQPRIPFVPGAIITITGTTPTTYNGSYTVITGTTSAVTVTSSVSTAVVTKGRIIGGGDIISNGFVTVSANITSANVIATTALQAPKVNITGNVSSSAWGTSGIGLVVSANTYTDASTAGSGTVASASINVINIPTITASNLAVTVTKASSLYIAGAPAAGANITLTNSYALQVAAGPVQIDTSTAATSATTGALRVAGGVGISGALYAGGGIASANTTSGSLVVTGGLGVSGDTYHGGSVLISGTGGLGYGTGSGGTVTQATSRTTGVTINKTNGAIVLISGAGSTGWQSFTVTNSAVVATDVVHVSQKSGTDLYQIFVTAIAAGSFRITYATTAGSTTEQPVFNFAVVKAVTA